MIYKINVFANHIHVHVHSLSLNKRRAQRGCYVHECERYLRTCIINKLLFFFITSVQDTQVLSK